MCLSKKNMYLFIVYLFFNYLTLTNSNRNSTLIHICIMHIRIHSMQQNPFLKQRKIQEFYNRKGLYSSIWERLNCMKKSLQNIFEYRLFRYLIKARVFF